MLSAAYSMEKTKIKFFCHFLELNQYQHFDMADYLERICELKHGKKDWEKYMKFTDNIVSDEELVEMINIADLMILPSRGEGFGFPIVEALYCGISVMASNNSTITEILENKIDSSSDFFLFFASFFSFFVKYVNMWITFIIPSYKHNCLIMLPHLSHNRCNTNHRELHHYDSHEDV